MFVDYGYQSESQDQEERQALAEAMGLKPSDIAQNQLGRLSDRQFLRLLGQGIGLAAPLLLGMLPILGLSALLALIVISDGVLWHYLPLRSWLSPRMLYAGWATVAGVFAMLVSLSGMLGHSIQGFLRLLRLTLDLSAGRVDCDCGRVSTNRSEDFDDILFRRTTRYYLCAADCKYEVREEAYRELDARHNTAFYMLYFTPRSRHLVALEPVLAAAAREPTGS